MKQLFSFSCLEVKNVFQYYNNYMNRNMNKKEIINKPVTQNDVAREAGVTRSMVSYVLNDTQGKSVASDTKQRILDAIAKLGYKPNKYAQALQLGNAALADKQIGVILSSADIFLRPYYAEVIAGIHTAAYENHYHVKFIRFFEELNNPILFNELIHPEEITGLILVAVDQCIKTAGDEQMLETIRKRISSIVCIDWQHKGLSSVGFSRRDASYTAASYLVKKGYGNIAYIGELDERVSGFRQALADAGRADSQTAAVEGAFTMEGGLMAAEKISSALPRAICAGSDEVAIGVMHYLNGHGISVPSQVAVVSIDNIEISEYTNPPLTTVNVQKKSMGARAVDMIVKGSAAQDENAVTILLPIDLVERASA